MKKAIKKDPIFENWDASGREMRIKHCFYPGCNSTDIIKAHAIQNTGILNQLSVNGQVYMPKPKANGMLPRLIKYGRKQATTFTGFCGEHDKKIFQPIEDENWQVNAKNVFLFSYRTFASEYQVKMESSNRFRILRDKLGNNQGPTEYERGVSMSIEDLADEKRLFDDFLLNGGKPPINYISWKIHQPIKFAQCGFNVPYVDFDGDKIQAPNDKRLHHIFYTIIPHNHECIAMISWLKTDNKRFKGYTRFLRKLNLRQRKQYLSNIAISISDTLVLSPMLVDKLNKNQKQLIEGEYINMEMFSQMVMDNYNSTYELENIDLNLFDY